MIKNISLAILTSGSCYGDDEVEVYTSSVDVMRKAMETAGKFAEYCWDFASDGNPKSLATLKATDSNDTDEEAALKLFKELAGKLDDTQKHMIDVFTRNWGTFENSWRDAFDAVVGGQTSADFNDDDMVFPAFGATSADAMEAVRDEEYNEEEVDDWED